jgi:predicted small secreted protein
MDRTPMYKIIAFSGSKQPFDESEKMLRKTVVLFALILALFSLAGCQTVQGLGRDMTWTGNKVDETLNALLYPPYGNP